MSATVPIDAKAPSAEDRARVAFEELGGPMTDREWKDAERRLAEFFRIAGEWAENSTP